MTRRRGRATATRNFGVGPRESHDSTAFYSRFSPKLLSRDATLADPFVIERPLVCGDARSMSLPDNSVALVVTSPPYFAGKEYEEALGRGVIPATYVDYLRLLTDVFEECLRVLEPGGRMAVNVANLGRKPYRSLSADVIRILDDGLGMLLRGEIVWRKADGAAGSCAWGSYRSPSNPVLRDVSERVIVASKGRFDRALDAKARQAQGRPHISTISTDEFLDATLDIWEIRPESARRVGHPAPFPVELPQRLIELYTFRDDVVLDPFLGSGTTAVAAVRCGRRFAGYDTDPGYIALAESRVREEQARMNGGDTADDQAGLLGRDGIPGGGPSGRGRVETEVARLAGLAAGGPAAAGPAAVGLNGHGAGAGPAAAESATSGLNGHGAGAGLTAAGPAGAGLAGTGRRSAGLAAGPATHRFAAPAPTPGTAGGQAARTVAVEVLEAAGFIVVDRDRKVRGLGLQVDLVARDGEGQSWYFDVTGAFASVPGGLVRAETLWKCLGRASVLRTQGLRPVVLISSHLPSRRSSGDRALRAVGPSAIHDVVGMLQPEDRDRLARYAAGGYQNRPPLPGFWSAGDLRRAGIPFRPVTART
jgi:DNA modification methylase